MDILFSFSLGLIFGLLMRGVHIHMYRESHREPVLSVVDTYVPEPTKNAIVSPHRNTSTKFDE